MRTGRLGLLAAALTLSLAVTQRSQAQVAQLSAGGTVTNLKLTDLGNGRFSVDPFALSGNGWTVTGTGLADMDPFISFSLSATNGTDAPLNFGFTFLANIAAVGIPNTVASQLSGTLTDGRGDGVSIKPFDQATVLAGNVGDPLANMGVDIGPSASHGSGNPGANYAYGPFNGGPTAGPGPGPWTTLEAVVSFTLSPHDSVSLTGLVSIEPGGVVPEPGALALLAGLVFPGMMLIRRRR